MTRCFPVIVQLLECSIVGHRKTGYTEIRPHIRRTGVFQQAGGADMTSHDIEGTVISLELEGLVFDVLLDSVFTSHPPDWYAGIHSHGEFEVHYAVSGSGVMHAGETSFALEPQMLCLVRPKVYHLQTTESGTSMQKYCLRFSVRDSSTAASSSQLTAKDTILQILSRHDHFCARFVSKTEELLHEIRNELHKRELAYMTQVQSKLAQLLVLTFRALNQDRSEKTAALQSPVGMRRIQVMDTFFALRYAEASTPADMAQALHVSERHLNRIMKKTYGCTFKQKMTAARMEAAKLLLVNTSMTSEQISEAVGYSSPSSFHQVFKTCTAMTPRRYRIVRRENMHEGPAS